MMENAVMLLYGTIRTTQCHIVRCMHESVTEEPPMLPWLILHARSILSRCQRHSKGCLERSRHKSSFRLVKKCWLDLCPQNR